VPNSAVPSPPSKPSSSLSRRRGRRATAHLGSALLSAIGLAASAAACAQGQTFDDDAGASCSDSACDDAATVDAGRHDSSTAHDAGVDAQSDGTIADAPFIDAPFDAPFFDAPLFDAPLFDAPHDSPGDAPSFDAPVDAPPFDAGTVCSGTLLSSGAHRYGNLSPFSSNSTHAPDDLLGMQVTVSQSGTLLGFGVYGRSAGPHLVLSLYTDVGGRPGALVGQAAAITSCVGTIEPPSTAQPQVPAGNYWILGVWDTTGSIGINLSAGATPVDWIAQPFAQALPASYPASSNRYTGQAFNYYVVVQ
jgi:hypothetical protein